MRHILHFEDVSDVPIRYAAFNQTHCYAGFPVNRATVHLSFRVEDIDGSKYWASLQPIVSYLETLEQHELGYALMDFYTAMINPVWNDIRTIVTSNSLPSTLQDCLDASMFKLDLYRASEKPAGVAVKLSCPTFRHPLFSVQTTQITPLIVDSRLPPLMASQLSVFENHPVPCVMPTSFKTADGTLVSPWCRLSHQYQQNRLLQHVQRSFRVQESYPDVSLNIPRIVGVILDDLDRAFVGFAASFVAGDCLQDLMSSMHHDQARERQHTWIDKLRRSLLLLHDRGISCGGLNQFSIIIDQYDEPWIWDLADKPHRERSQPTNEEAAREADLEDLEQLFD